jgi:hypothetical protein
MHVRTSRVSGEQPARPLGARPDVRLTPAQLRTLAVLQDFDLGPVRARLVKDAAMPAGWVDDAILEFRRYLGLRVLHPEPIDMFSKHVDDVWHTCLLFSRLYAGYCEEAFGHFVHHEPASGHDAARGGESSRPDRATRWRAFREAYEQMYGDLPRLWRMAEPKSA